MAGENGVFGAERRITPTAMDGLTDSYPVSLASTDYAPGGSFRVFLDAAATLKMTFQGGSVDTWVCAAGGVPAIVTRIWKIGTTAAEGVIHVGPA